MALFTELARLAESLAGEGSRLKKRAAIAEAIAAAHSGDPEGENAGLFAMFLAGTPFAESDSRKLNAGGALLSKAVKAVSGATDAALSAAYRRHGDLGAAAFDLWPSSMKETLTLVELQDAFAGMAAARTTAIRAALVEGLLRRATAIEAKYLLKLMLGDMRIGVKQSLVEEAIAVAASVAVTEVRRALMLEADLSAAVAMAFAGRLGEARMRLFHPLGFMLASPVETPEEAVERFTAKPVREGKRDKAGSGNVLRPAHREEQERDGWGTRDFEESGEKTEPKVPEVEAFLEDKYDGMRAQVHCGEGGRVAIYSRNKEEITESFPELVEAFSLVDNNSGGLILDGEILGWDFATGQALPFAVMGQRIGRKKVSAEVMRTIPAVFMAFDLLYTGEELLLERPLRERRNLLEGVSRSSEPSRPCRCRLRIEGQQRKDSCSLQMRR